MLKNLKIRQFGGIRNKEMGLEKGLNIILGDNETGKSSFMKALYSLLFQDAKYRTKADEAFVKAAIPYPRGDTASASVRFLLDGVDYEIEKEWNQKRPRTAMRTNGEEMTDERTVKARIRELFPLGEGTYRAIIFSDQNDFRRIFQHISKDKESYQEIRGLMKRVSTELSGLSIQGFQEHLNEVYEKLTKSWNMRTGAPATSKRYSSKAYIGTILGHHYEIEDIEKQIHEAEAVETEFSNTSLTLDQKGRALGDMKRELLKTEYMEEILGKYEAVLQAQARMAEYEKDYREWSELEENRLKLRLDRKEKESEHEKLSKYQKVSDKMETLKKAEGMEAELMNLRRQRVPYARFTPEIGARFTSLQQEIRENALRLDALAMRVTVNRGSLRVLDESQREWQLSSGEQTLLHGYGRMVTPDGTDIELRSCHQDTDILASEKIRLHEEMEALKQELNQFDENLIAGFFLKCQEMDEQIRQAEERLRFLDLNFDRAEIKKAAEEFEDSYGGSLSSLDSKLQFLSKAIGRLEAEEGEQDRRIRELTDAYGTRDGLLKKWMDQQSSVKEAEAEFMRMEGKCGEFQRELTPFLKELIGFSADSEGLRTRAAKLRGHLKDLRDRESELREEEVELRYALDRIKRSLSDTSVEELNASVSDHRKKLERTVNRAEKLERIKALFEETCLELEQESGDLLTVEFERNLSLITGGRYDATTWEKMDEVRIFGDGRELTADLLSVGTFESVALAFRLATFNQLMEGRDGFLVLDDCLLNMDGERRKRAANLIEQYAGTYQILFITCSREIADLFSAQTNLVALV